MWLHPLPIVVGPSLWAIGFVALPIARLPPCL
jgi:hypothetical protein